MRPTLIVLLLFVLAACSPVPSPALSPLPAPTATAAPVKATSASAPQASTSQPPQPLKEGMGGVSGRLSTKPATWEGQEITAYACPFTPNKDGTGGFFILEATIHPRAVVAPDGSFRIADVPPGAYVIVAGPTPEEALAYRDTDQPAVIEVAAGKIVELGDIEVR
jgi:hypothetical protein